MKIREMIKNAPKVQDGLDFVLGEQTVENLMRKHTLQELNKLYEDLSETRSDYRAKQLKLESQGNPDRAERFQDRRVGMTKALIILDILIKSNEKNYE